MLFRSIQSNQQGIDLDMCLNIQVSDLVMC